MEYKISELNDHHPGTELKAKLFICSVQFTNSMLRATRARAT